ncbi:MAG: tRNA guanosine(34) transglycosylase Tgt [Pseudomonadota bacterium]|jgi:queuine tRNA-ribosyltransferase
MSQKTRGFSCVIDGTDQWSNARALTVNTLHGEFKTPIFMPVATQAALRHVDLAFAEQLDYGVLLANTYHLMVRPGIERFQEFGDIHTFMRWPNSVLTDSGGFQLFSLSKQIRISEEGARFRSYTDGRWIKLSPESSIEMQKAIGSDIMMVLDHCLNSTSDISDLRRALELTTRWAKRSLAARGDSNQALFGIVQGGCDEALRRESASYITELPFDGYALGGLAVGETKSQREDTIEFAAPLLPFDKPRYVMGIGTPIDLLEAVRRGADMFDCILPTALATQGVAFTSLGKVDLRKGVYRSADIPLDQNCQCSTCRRFSRAYLHHIVKSKESIAPQFISIHNLTFYRGLMQRMRQAILEGTFSQLYANEAPLISAS